MTGPSLLSTCVAASLATALLSIPSTAAAGDSIFDEARFGASMGIQPGRTHESGVFPTATLFFDPLGSDSATGFSRLLHPRIHAGTILSTSGQASQVYAGFDWEFTFGDGFFINPGIGGTIHNGDLKYDGSRGPKLGSRVMFHEFIAAGVNIDENWRVLVTVDHSSNANLAGDNDGLSYAGLSIGYKF